MLIIIEGCDCTGKSTIAGDLCHKADARYLHFGPPEQDEGLDEYEGEPTLRDYRPGSGENLVVDRFHLGERVYGPIYRGESRLDVHQLHHVNLWLRSRGASLIVTAAEDDTVLERMLTRGEASTRAQDVGAIQDEFRAQFDLSREVLDDLTWWDTTTINDEKMDIATWHLLGDSAEAEYRVRHLAAFPGYIGSPRPRWLLLGDERNHNTPEHLAEMRQLPFIPLAGNSGHYLMRAIESHLAFVGIANSAEVDVRALWETLDKPYVVALGRKAQDRCAQAFVPHRGAYHPQFWRRFHHNELAAYRADLFKEGLQ